MKNVNKIRVITASITIMVLAIFFPKITSAQEKAVADTSNKIFEMSLEDLLNTSVTTVSKTAEKQSDAPGIISVITKDELNRFGGTTLKDILERVPGLTGSTVYMTDRSTIAPRGDQIQPSSSHVLFLINGRPVREALEGGIKSEIYESFPVNIIERIEVIKGPGSVLYGSNAFSAVINVITEKAEKTGFSVTGLAGNAGTYGAMSDLKLKAGDFSAVIAGRYFQKPEWKTEYRYFNPTTNNVDEVSMDIPNKGPGAYAEVNYKNLRIMGSYNEWENSYMVTDYAFVFPAYGTAKWKKAFGDIGYSVKVNKIWDMNFNTTYTRSLLSTSSWPNVNRDSYEALGEWTNFINPNEKLRIIFGGLYNYFKGREGTSIPEENDHRYSFGIYTQIDYQIMKNLKLLTGLQANKIKDIDMNIVPRLGLIYYPLEPVNVKILYSQAFRAPSINELGLMNPAMHGNPNLSPEKVNSFDVAINYQKEKVQLGLNFFQSNQTGIIYQDRVNYTVPTYNNIGEVSLQGVEFEGKYYLSNTFFFEASMLYQESKDGADVKNVVPIANFGSKGGISYKSDKGITISLFDLYQSSMDKKYETSLNPSPGAYNVMNLHFAFDFDKYFGLKIGQEFTLTAQVDNLFNKQIWLPNWGLLPGSSIPYIQGRLMHFGLGLTF